MTYRETHETDTRDDVITKPCAFLGCSLPGMSTFDCGVVTTQGDGPTWVVCAIHTQALRLIGQMAEVLDELLDEGDNGQNNLPTALVFMGTNVERGVDWLTDEYAIDDAEAERSLTPMP